MGIVKRILVATSAALVIGWVCLVAPAKAANVSQGLQISPVLFELNADPGKSYVLHLSLLNVTTADLNFKSFVNDFEAADETGTPQVILQGHAPATSSLASWITPPASLTIKAKQTKAFDIHLTVPVNAEPGGHYGVVRFNSSAPQIDQTGVALTASTGPLILVRVSGDIRESLTFKDFFTARGDHHQGLFESSPINIVERIANNGNVHVKPVGDIVVSNMFGKAIANLPINDQKGNVLPTSIRRFQQQLSKKWMFGRYTAKAQLAYGTKGQTLDGQIAFWVIPYRLILFALTIILIITLLLRILIKHYNQKIIKKAMTKTNDQPGE